MLPLLGGPPLPQVLEVLLQAGCPVSPPPRFQRFKRGPETPLSLSTYRSYGPRVGGWALPACLLLPCWLLFLPTRATSVPGRHQLGRITHMHRPHPCCR